MYNKISCTNQTSLAYIIDKEKKEKELLERTEEEHGRSNSLEKARRGRGTETRGELSSFQHGEGGVEWK